MNVLAAVLSGFAAALVAPWLSRATRRATGGVLALLPLGLTFYFINLLGTVRDGARTVEQAWVPSLGVSLSFHLDGLSLLFAILISGIGALVILYAGEYLRDDAHLPRFFAYLLMFMASMLGLVLSGNLLAIFVFWELTSFSSYLLIGHDHERPAARAAALQALLVTGLGGLAMLAGFLILGSIAGGYEMKAVLAGGGAFREHALYLPALALVLAGAFTKSAQFPFHFWLPNAMEAPSPVSAYLHSATMVKAGVYLMMRLHPALGGTAAWTWALGVAGGATLLLGAFLAFRSVDYKRVLAYSTVSVLGLLTMLLGVGTEAALTAAVVYLFAHALYKGALFLVAGAVAHATGARDLDQLSGLRRAMPITAAAAGLAALSLAGLPPFLGFISKELLYEARHGAVAALAVSFIASVLLVAVAAMAGWQPFFGAKVRAPKPPHEAPFALWFGPALLAALGLVFGLFPALVQEPMLSPAISAVAGRAQQVTLSLWHGFSLTLALSAATIGAGVALYAARGSVGRVVHPLEELGRFGPQQWYAWTLRGLQASAEAVTALFQSGYLRYYILTTVATAVGLAGYTLATRGEVPLRFDVADIRLYELAVAVLMVLGTYEVLQTRSRLGAIAALGAVGYGVALTFVLFGAPDLAMTQFLIETLFVILFVLVFHHLPSFARLSSRRARLRDAVLAIAFGAMMTSLVLAVRSVQADPKLSQYFMENSATLAHGRNVVNVILVDFRGLDTLGEITVLSIAAIGVYALLKLRLARKEAP